jgi:nucleoside-diphosphate-sugar epimerase
MARVLVTGASGFVGRAVVEALRPRGHEIHAVARTAVPEIRADAWHEADLLDAASVDELVRSVAASHLLHLAWTTEHGAFWADPSNLAWSSATLQLFDVFAAAGGVRSVLAGSCAQYDWDPGALGPSGRADETESPRRPVTLYGIAKESTSRLLTAWASARGLSHATALLFFPYGPFDKAERLVPSLSRDLLAGRISTVKTGADVRDFVHIDDCGAALAALVDSGATGDVNIGTGHGSSIADVTATVARIVGREDLLRIEPLPAGTTASTVVASVRRLHDEVGFVAQYDLESGIRRTADWLRHAWAGAEPAALQRTRRR